MDDDDDMMPIALEPQLNEEEETLTTLQSHEQRSRDDGVGMTYEDLCKAHIVSRLLFSFTQKLRYVLDSNLTIFFSRNNTLARQNNTSNRQLYLSA